MSKDHDLGLASARLVARFAAAGRAFLWASVPLRAADKDSEGEVMPRIIGGANRRREVGLPMKRVGDRPAAAGAEHGVVRTAVTDALGCGVTVVTVPDRDRYGFASVVVSQRFLHTDFAREMSSSMHPRLRLLELSNTPGSMFSESESSGDSARLFRLEAG